MLKQDMTMYRIISEIVSGKKQKNESIRKKDYEITSKQMTIIFKKLSESDVIERTPDSVYVVTGRSIKNAQEFCLEEISKYFDEICDIAAYGNISDERLRQFLDMRIDDRRGEQK